MVLQWAWQIINGGRTNQANREFKEIKIGTVLVQLVNQNRPIDTNILLVYYDYYTTEPLTSFPIIPYPLSHHFCAKIAQQVPK